jgi:CheY-like chemotaxis protein
VVVVKWILLADDSGDDAEFVQTALKTAGVGNSVVVVNDGQQAINYLRGEGDYSDRKRFPAPDVLLLDLAMPGVDGFEVLEWIRSQPSLKEMLVIVLSGLHGLREINRAYSLGANSFLIKPANPVEIANLVASFPEYWSPAVPEPPNETAATIGTPRLEDGSMRQR